MIKNDLELLAAKENHERLQKRFAEVSSWKEELRKRLELNAIALQINTIKDDLTEYSRLKKGVTKQIDFVDLADLPDTLVAARIASGLSEKELGDKLFLHERQVQHDEATRYRNATFSRLLTVANELGVRIVGVTYFEANASGATAAQPVESPDPSKHVCNFVFETHPPMCGCGRYEGQDEKKTDGTR